jgi:uncharacterized BrkB/YihY/UPF0761 family membrane protein
MFRLLGVLLALYVGWSVLRGTIHAKRAAWGETIERDADPQRFWTVALYVGLALALVFIF